MLYQGDCLEVMDRLIEEGIKVDAIITDIPYGTTACRWDSIIPFDDMWNRLKLLRNDRTPIVLFGSQPFTSNLIVSNIKEFRYNWVWNKVNLTTGSLLVKKQPMKDNEDIVVFYKEQCLYNPQMIRGKPYTMTRNTKGVGEVVNDNMERKTTVNKGEYYPIRILDFKGWRRPSYHPTQKPIELMEYLIKTYTNEGDTVLDFTMGSGSTGVACMNTNRKFIGIELDVGYFNIAKKRMG